MQKNGQTDHLSDQKSNENHPTIIKKSGINDQMKINGQADHLSDQKSNKNHPTIIK